MNLESYSVRLHPFRYLTLIFVVLLLSLVSLRNPLLLLKPLWAFLLILYLYMIRPAKHYLFLSVFLGLILDVSTSAALGVHVFALSMVAWCVSSRARRFRFWSLFEQMAWVGLLSVLYQGTIALISWILHEPTFSVGAFFIPIASSILFWTWIKWMFDYILGSNSTSAIYN